MKHRHSLKQGLALSWSTLFYSLGSLYFGFARFSSKAGKAVDEVSENVWVSLFVAFWVWSFVISGYVAQFIAKLLSIPGHWLMRSQEYEADLEAAKLVGPEYMYSVLEKLEALNDRLVEEELESLPYADRWQLQPANPSLIDKLFNSHPPTEQRTNRL